MCDYCDCRSHPQIAALSRDHETLLDRLAELRAAVDADDAERARPVLAALHELLGSHAAREERGVFHQLRNADVDGAYVAMFERDHERLHELLGDTGGAGWRAAAPELIELLRGHIAREESDLFPAAHQVLTPSQWDAVDAAVAAPADLPRELTLARTTGAPR
jgi:hemerythrin-like domain-containing protein